jgi:hypothetical protein
MSITNNKTDSAAGAEQRHTGYTRQPSLDIDNVIAFPYRRATRRERNQKLHSPFAQWLWRALHKTTGALLGRAPVADRVAGQRKGETSPARHPRGQQADSHGDRNSAMRKRMYG